MSYEAAKESSSASDPEGSSSGSGPGYGSGSSASSSSCDCDFEVTDIVIGGTVAEGSFTLANLGTCTLEGIEVEPVGGGVSYTLVLVVPDPVPPGGTAEVSVAADGDIRGTQFIVRASCGDGVWEWPV